MTDNITQKKDEIARVFMKHFQEFGMKKTIVKDVAKELGMSKKTIYKYFDGGKPEALYFFFYRIASQYVEFLDPELAGFSPQEKLEYLSKQILSRGSPLF